MHKLSYKALMEDDDKKSESGSEKRNQPYIPNYPNKPEKQKQEETDPNPNSDPNYSFYPGIAYPQKDTEKDEEAKYVDDPEKKNPESL
jgi:hypothetical protein